MLRRITGFVTDVAKYTYRNVRRFTRSIVTHAETVTVLSLSAIGLNTMVGEVPMVYAAPMWIESPMVIPVISVLAISMLVKSAEWRARKRGVIVVD